LPELSKNTINTLAGVAKALAAILAVPPGADTTPISALVPNPSREVDDALQDRHGRYYTFADLKTAQAEIEGCEKDSPSPVKLIDRLAGILAEYNLTSSYLSPDILDELRLAILRKDELDSIATRLNDSLRCNRCGFRFTQSELAIVATDSSGSPGVCCHKCVQPIYARCHDDGCKNHASLPKKFLQFLVHGFSCGIPPNQPAATQAQSPQIAYQALTNPRFRGLSTVSAGRSQNRRPTVPPVINYTIQDDTW
jgi:hypothetical protein